MAKLKQLTAESESLESWSLLKAEMANLCEESLATRKKLKISLYTAKKISRKRQLQSVNTASLKASWKESWKYRKPSIWSVIEERNKWNVINTKWKSEQREYLSEKPENVFYYPIIIKRRNEEGMKKKRKAILSAKCRRKCQAISVKWLTMKKKRKLKRRQWRSYLRRNLEMKKVWRRSCVCEMKSCTTSASLPSSWRRERKCG